MQKIDIYTRPNCVYCVRAKKLLNNMGLNEYNEYTIGNDATKEDIEKRLNDIGRNDVVVKTVPQIFIDNEYVGGFTELEKRLS